MTLDMRTLVHRGGAGDDLCEKLGIPAQPVIEWHTWSVTSSALDPVPFGAPGWRYLAVAAADATNRAGAAFDDSTWSTGSAAFGNAATQGWPAPATITDPTQALWLRRTVAAHPGQALQLQLRAAAAAVDVYWNGQPLVDPAAVPGDLVAASNLLAVRVQPVPEVVAGGADIWATRAVLPVATTDHAGAVVDGKVYMTSGGNTYKQTQCYDPATDTWTTKAQQPDSRFSHLSGAVAGKVYLLAGIRPFGGGMALPTLCYDVATDTYTTKASIPGGRWIAGATAPVVDGKLYVIGGYDQGVNPQATNYCYDPAADTWTTKAPLPVAMAGCVSVAAAGKIYVIGGGAASVTRCYDPATNTWATKTPPPAPVDQSGAAELDGKIYVIGGSGFKKTTLCYDPATDTWATREPIPVGVYVPVVAAAAGDLYVMGGQRSGGPTNAVYRFTPAPSASPARLYADANLDTPPGTPGVPRWVVDPARTAALTHYTASYGRQNPTGNTEPLQVSTGLVEQLAGDQLPTVGERFRLTIAAPVAAALGLADTDRPRFTGEVTDVDVDTEGLISLAGVGRAARLGRVAVGGTRWPAESTGNRVARILAAVSTQLPLDLGALDAGGPQLLARPGAVQPAGQLLEQVSTATTGQLLEQRTGQLEWHNETHRRNPVSALTLAAAELLKPFRWTQRVGTVVNDARVTYGDPQATVVVADPTSTDPAEGLGPYPVAISTELVDQADAYALGSVIVGRRATPTWELPQVTVDLVRTAGAKAGAALGLRHGALVTTTGLPAIGPYTVRDVFVEGATETFTRTSWRLSLTVADKALAGVALRWIDVPAAETWDTITPTLTWLGVATAATTDL